MTQTKKELYTSITVSYVGKDLKRIKEAQKYTNQKELSSVVLNAVAVYLLIIGLLKKDKEVIIRSQTEEFPIPLTEKESEIIKDYIDPSTESETSVSVLLEAIVKSLEAITSKLDKLKDPLPQAVR